MPVSLIGEFLDQHRNTERVLMLIRAQCDALPCPGPCPQLPILEAAIGYLNGFPSLVHHPAEELMLKYAARRAPSYRPLFARLARQHHRLLELEKELARSMAAARAGDAQACAAIKQTGMFYCTDYEQHIRTEDAEFLPHVAGWLLPGDWREIEAVIAEAPHCPQLKRTDNLYEFLTALAPVTAAGAASGGVRSDRPHSS